MLVQEEARFAQTRVGWILRGLSHVYPDQVFEFLQQHQEHVSVECMRMATARLSDKKRKALGVTWKRKRRQLQYRRRWMIQVLEGLANVKRNGPRLLWRLTLPDGHFIVCNVGMFLDVTRAAVAAVCLNGWCTLAYDGTRVYKQLYRTCCDATANLSTTKIRPMKKCMKFDHSNDACLQGASDCEGY